jgi:membrane fusion protein, multidrug efflux system
MANQSTIEEKESNNAEAARDPGPRSGEKSRPRKSPSGRKWIFLLVPIAALVIGYYVYQNYFAGRETTDDAQIDGHINPIAAKVSGLVTAIYVEDNQHVEQGTLLVRIDSRDYQVALDRARADLAAAESAARAAHQQVPITSTATSSQISSASAAVEQATGAGTAALKEVDTARARLGSAEARARETQANYTKAVQDLERMKQLIAKDEISRQQYDAAVAAADAARAARDSAQASIEEASRAVEAAQARVTQAEARIKEARAGLEATSSAPQQLAVTRSNAQSATARVQQMVTAVQQAELNLSYTEVRAPISGLVSQRKVEVGQYVQPGQPLLAIVPLKQLWVTANFKENQLKEMQPGQRAVVTVDAYGGREYRGYVDSIAAATGAKFSLLPPENATGNYVKVVQRVPVKIMIDSGDDPRHPLRPGMSVVATVVTADRQDRSNASPAQGNAPQGSNQAPADPQRK